MIEEPPPRKRYKIKGRETWAEVRKGYLGGASARELAAKYDVTVRSIYKKSSAEGWGKRSAPETPEPWIEPEPVEPTPVEPRPPLVLRAAQRPPKGDWATWLFLGGRGAGKTLAGAEWVAERARAVGRIALVGATIHDVREVMVEGPSGIRGLPRYDAPERPEWGRPVYEPTRKRLVWPNGAVGYAFSAEDPESLRGPQHGAAWADELCAWPKPEETLALLRMGLRLGADPRLVVTTTPKPLAALRQLRAEASCRGTHAPTADNAGNLSPAFLEGLTALYGGTRRAAQELDGLLVETDGALWRAEELVRCRGALPAGPFERVVVGVDPPASAGGDACGIVVAGRIGGRAWVLEDASAAGLSHLGWARRAAAAAERWGAGVVVAEMNQGGDMVRTVLAGAGVGCPVRLVHAAVGKRARAEPVAALYEQGRVVHAGVWPALEEELIGLGEAGGASPDRADALVWALTALLVEAEAPRMEPRIRLL